MDIIFRSYSTCSWLWKALVATALLFLLIKNWNMQTLNDDLLAKKLEYKIKLQEEENLVNNLQNSLQDKEKE